MFSHASALRKEEAKTENVTAHDGRIEVTFSMVIGADSPLDGSEVGRVRGVSRTTRNALWGCSVAVASFILFVIMDITGPRSSDRLGVVGIALLSVAFGACCFVLLLAHGYERDALAVRESRFEAFRADPYLRDLTTQLQDAMAELPRIRKQRRESRSSALNELKAALRDLERLGDEYLTKRYGVAITDPAFDSWQDRRSLWRILFKHEWDELYRWFPEAREGR